MTEISFTFMRISIPPLVTSITSSSSFTWTSADHLAVPLGGLDVDDALPAAALHPVLGLLGALAVAVLGDGEDGGALLHHVGAHHLVAVLQRDALHAVGGAAHGAHLALREADAHALRGGEQDVLGAVGDLHRHQRVALVDAQRDDARWRARWRTRSGPSASPRPRLVTKKTNWFSRKSAVTSTCGQLLALAELHQVDDRPCRARCGWPAGSRAP